MSVELFHLLSSAPLALLTLISFCPSDFDFAANLVCHRRKRTKKQKQTKKQKTHPSSFPNGYGDGDYGGDGNDDGEFPVEL